NPILALHTIVDFAGVGDLRRERTGRHSGLPVGLRAERRQVEAPSNFLALDEVVKRVQPSHGLGASRRVPKIGARQIQHLGPGSSVDKNLWLRWGFGGKEEVWPARNPGRSVL